MQDRKLRRRKELKNQQNTLHKEVCSQNLALMDSASCSSHRLPNFTYFRNLLTPDAVRDTLFSGPDYTVLFLELVQHHSSRSCREHNECRRKHDFSDTQTLTKLPAAGTTVKGPLNTSSCAAAPFRNVFPNQPETSLRTPPGLCIFC